MTAPGQAGAQAALDAHGDELMRQTGAFACGIRQEAGGQWVLVVTVAAPPARPPPAMAGGYPVRIEAGEAMRPL